jgi:hypothetical protein
MTRKALTSLPSSALKFEASLCLKQAKKTLDELYYACTLKGVDSLTVYTEARTVIGYLSRLMAVSRALRVKALTLEEQHVKVEG